MPIKTRANIIRYEAEHLMNAHVDGCHRLSILVRGSIREGDGRRAETLQPGAVGFKSDQFVHENEFGADGATIVSIVLPSPRLHLLAGGDLLSWRWNHSGTNSLQGLRLASALLRKDDGVTEDAVRKILFHLRATPPRPFATGNQPAWLPHVLRELRNSDRSRSIEDISNELERHPVALGRAFRRHVGCSASEYRHRCRIHRVAVTLLQENASLTDLALKNGFSDLSHMTRTFRRLMDIPPGAYRDSFRDVSKLDSFKTEWSLSF